MTLKVLNLNSCRLVKINIINIWCKLLARILVPKWLIKVSTRMNLNFNWVKNLNGTIEQLLVRQIHPRLIEIKKQNLYFIKNMNAMMTNSPSFFYQLLVKTNKIYIVVFKKLSSRFFKKRTIKNKLLNKVLLKLKINNK